MATPKHHASKDDQRRQHNGNKAGNGGRGNDAGKSEDVIPGGQGRVKNPSTDRRLKQNRS